MSKLVFVHVPKTAGTTLINIAVRQYLPWQVYLSRVNLECVANDMKYASSKKGLRLILGHVPFGALGEPSRELSYFTFLRNPTSLAISLYKHVCREPSHLHYDAVKEMTFREFLNSPFYVPNVQTRYISSDFAKKYKLLDVGLDGCECAQEVIRSSMVSFGIAEQFDESMIYFINQLGWRMAWYVPQRVASNQCVLAEDDLKFVREINNLDYDLYDEAKRILAERCNSIPSFNKKLHLYRCRNKRYGWLFSQYGRVVKRMSRSSLVEDSDV